MLRAALAALVLAASAGAHEAHDHHSLPPGTGLTQVFWGGKQFLCGWIAAPMDAAYDFASNGTLLVAKQPPSTRTLRAGQMVEVHIEAPAGVVVELSWKHHSDSFEPIPATSLYVQAPSEKPCSVPSSPLF